MDNIKTKRTAREIKVNPTLLKNKDVSVKIGTVENRDSPDTIYIFISFWAKPSGDYKNESQEDLKLIINKNLDDIYEGKIKNFLMSSDIFINEKDAIFIKNIPENINYNEKRNFFSIELYLHTSNIKNKNAIPLSNKKDTTMFDEAVKITNIIIDSEFLKSNKQFNIFKKSM